MRVTPAVLAVALIPISGSAALPPAFQNAKDLDVMVTFVRNHKVVLESLRSIDFENKVVGFGSDCVAKFGRALSTSIRPGPAPALEYKDATCPIGRDDAAPRN